MLRLEQDVPHAQNGFVEARLKQVSVLPELVEPFRSGKDDVVSKLDKHLALHGERDVINLGEGIRVVGS
jgi:hypothetical protein